MASKRMLELKRIEPRFVPKVHICVGESFSVAARVFADNISTCEVILKFDAQVLEETSRNPNPWRLRGPAIDTQVRWELRGKKAIAESFVILDAHGNGLPQKSEFAVEVTP